MDPVSAAGLASSIIAFVEFSTRILQGSYEIYSSGSETTSENIHIGNVIEDLEKVTGDMSSRIKGVQDPELSLLCTKCCQLSSDLRHVLAKLKAKHPDSKWASVVASWKAYHKRKDVASLEKRLEKYSQQISLRLSIILCAEQSSVREQLDALQKNGLTYSSATAQEMRDIRKDVRSLFDLILDKQTKMQGPDACDTFQKLKESIVRLASLVPTMPRANIVLQRLYFDSIFHREDQITDPSDNTFDWMIDWDWDAASISDSGDETSSDRSIARQQSSDLISTHDATVLGEAPTVFRQEVEAADSDPVAETKLSESSMSRADPARVSRRADENEETKTSEVDTPENASEGPLSDRVSVLTSSSGSSSDFTLRQAEDEHRRECSRTLQEFLRCKTGTYFICGKAGCGKSTMMKYLASNDLVHDELKLWAKEKQKALVTVRIFFWRSGTPLQMSCEGFYRSALFHTLRQCPEMIDTIFPPESLDLWQGSSSEPFRFADLKNAFERLSSLSTFGKYRICYFVDGLDEYEGGNTEHRWLGKHLKDWSQLDDVKVVCAARPHTVFLDVFRDSGATILLHELNQQDIYGFATQKFRSTLNKDEFDVARENCLCLTNRIVEKAEGVFFWAVIVVRSLLNSALGHDDAIESLEQRLDEFPPDLNSLFDQLIQGVDKSPSTRRRFESLLLGALENSPRRNMTAMIFSFLEDASWFENDNNHNYPCNIPSRPMLDEEIESRQQRVRRMLHQLTNGLLEMVEDRAQMRRHPYWKYQVTFLHRSVRDYLVDYWVVKPEIRERQKQLRESLAFARLCLAEAKFRPCVFTQNEGYGYAMNMPEDLILYLGLYIRSSSITTASVEPIISDLEKTIQAQRQLRIEAEDEDPVLRSIAYKLPRPTYRGHSMSTVKKVRVDGKYERAEGSFLHWLLLSGSTEHALRRIECQETRADTGTSNSISLLLASTMNMSKSESAVKCTRYFLEQGARPHDVLKTYPLFYWNPEPKSVVEVWHVLLLQFATIATKSPGQYEYLHQPSAMLELYLEFGADTNVFFLVQRLADDVYDDDDDDDDDDSVYMPWEPPTDPTALQIFRAEFADIVKLAQPENINAILAYLDGGSGNKRMWWRSVVTLAVDWIGARNSVAEAKEKYKLASYPELRRGKWKLHGLVSHRGTLDGKCKVRVV